jgi:hypothetical protein
MAPAYTGYEVIVIRNREAYEIAGSLGEIGLHFLRLPICLPQILQPSQGTQGS